MPPKSSRAKRGPIALRARQLDRIGSRTPAGSRFEEVLESAANLFFTKGYHGTTIEDVARDVGMLKGSLYYYIKSKDGLLYEILYKVIEQGDAYIAKQIDPQGDPVAQLQKALEAQIDYIIQNRVRVGLFLHEFDALSGKRQQTVISVMTRYNNRFIELIRRGQQHGKFMEGDPGLIVNGVLGMCNWIYRWHDREHGIEPAAIKRVFVQIIMKGLAKP